MLNIKKFMTMLATCGTILSGCTTMPPTEFHSSVDSIARPDAAAKKRYILAPGKKDVEIVDLQFQEFASYINQALTENGFIKSPTLQEADVVIFLTYGISNPQTYQYTYSLPTWGQTGISSANTYGTISSSGNSATYSGNTTYTPTYGVTGSTTHLGTIITYTRFLLLDAYDVATYSKENKMNHVWETHVVSAGPSNDLRLVVPYMVAAMKQYLGTNTGRKVEVTVLEDDPAVQILRGEQTQAIK